MSFLALLVRTRSHLLIVGVNMCVVDCSGQEYQYAGGSWCKLSWLVLGFGCWATDYIEKYTTKIHGGPESPGFNLLLFIVIHEMLILKKRSQVIMVPTDNFHRPK